MLTGLDEGSGGLASARIQAPIVGQEPGQPGPPGAGRRLAVEKRREQAQSVDEFAHCRSGRRVWGWGQ